jgi:murein peptide amidase A
LIGTNVAQANTLDGDFGPRPVTATAKPRRLDPPLPEVPWTFGEIGRSRLGVPIERWDYVPPAAAVHVAVICGLHGDERAAEELADGFGSIRRPPRVHLTIVPRANPDGWAAQTRNNSNGVDLNRNFSWGWNRRDFSGRRPMSEPETQALAQFVAEARPSLTVWMHQPLDYVAPLPGCPDDYANVWSYASRVPVRRNLLQVGGAETWTAMELGLPSLLVEIAGTRTAPVDVARHITALEALLPLVRPI